MNVFPLTNECILHFDDRRLSDSLFFLTPTARNNTSGDGSGKLADPFEEKVSAVIFTLALHHGGRSQCMQLALVTPELTLLGWPWFPYKLKGEPGSENGHHTGFTRGLHDCS